MAKYLTKRQMELLGVIHDLMLKPDGEAPTYKELAGRINVKSLATIALHLKALARKGYIQIIPGAHRGIRILRTSENEDLLEVPVLGTTAGGPPILAEENIKGHEKISTSAVTSIPDFLLEVKGDSMIEAGINEGDLVAVKREINIENGDIVVFMIDDESTVKRFYKENGCIILKPANKNYPNIIIRNDGAYLTPVGKIVGVIKKKGETKEIPRFIIDQSLNSPIKPMRKKNARDNTFQIQSRRYLGNKFKLLSPIKRIVEERCRPYSSLCDIFAGTGVVGEHFNSKDVNIISNELLYSNYISLYAWLSPEYFERDKIEEYIDMLNSLPGDSENYVSINYGGTYFTHENARKIGTIREKIEEMKVNFKEKCILLTSLLYAVDKIANTCGHYDAFRKKLDTMTPLKLLIPNIRQEENLGNELYNQDANILINVVEPDILYIDPPYNSRQYSDSYHFLENLATWKKPNLYGKAKKMDRFNLKSRYCLKSAGMAFAELINNAKCKHILVSYNNTGEGKDGRSNARIKDNEIVRTLEEKGKVEIFEQDYKAFTTGRSETVGHTERIFYCKVAQ